MNRAPNEATTRNQLERGTWVAAPPAMARKTKPEATHASSMTGSFFKRNVYETLMAMYTPITVVSTQPASTHESDNATASNPNPTPVATRESSAPEATGRWRFTGWSQSAEESLTSFSRYRPDAAAQRIPNAPNALRKVV